MEARWWEGYSGGGEDVSSSGQQSGVPAHSGPARPRREAVLLFGAIFTRNRLICLRPLPSITAASLGEKGGKRQTLAFCLKRNQ